MVGSMQLLILAFESALYPTLLAVVVILLSLERPVRMLASYLAGGLTVSIGVGIVVVETVGGTVHSSRAPLSVSVDLAVGGLALLVAVVLATRADERLRHRRARSPGQKPEREPWTQRILARESTPLVFFAAMAINVPGAAYLVALKDISAGHHSTGTNIALIVVFNLIMFLLAEIPLAGLLLAPERTRTVVTAVNDWLTSHGRALAIAVCATLGAFLIARGIAHAM
jgi:hypothetical protein